MLGVLFVQEFLVSPVQLGIPYSRPRYFAVMKKTHGVSADTAACTAFPLQAAPSVCSSAKAVHEQVWPSGNQVLFWVPVFSVFAFVFSSKLVFTNIFIVYSCLLWAFALTQVLNGLAGIPGSANSACQTKTVSAVQVAVPT